MSSSSLAQYAHNKLKAIVQANRYRTSKPTLRTQGASVERGGKRLISFSCNDYLGLSHHPEVIQAGKEALERYGAGAGAASLVTGYSPLLAELEAALAAYKGTEAACIFGSGYLANIGTIPALVGEGDLILADKLIHACLLDGARLSGAKLLRFAHNDIIHAEQLLSTHRNQYQRCLIITETVFSMDGDSAPIAALSELCQKYDSWLMTDDAHGLGVMVAAKGVDIQMGTLSKAVGAYGGYVCGSNALIDYLKNSARSYIFSTALPPSVVASSLASLRIIKHDKERTAKPLANAKLFTSLLSLPEAQSPIVAVILGEEEKALAASEQLEAEGFLVSAIRPPTVAQGSSRLRVTFSSEHSCEDVERLAQVLAPLLKE